MRGILIKLSWPVMTRLVIGCYSDSILFELRSALDLLMIIPDKESFLDSSETDATIAALDLLLDIFLALPSDLGGDSFYNLFVLR